MSQRSIPPRAEPPSPICRLLRTKTAFASGEEGGLWQLGASTTAAYWCLATMEPFGPDESYCHPHVCGDERACYVPRAG
jgi:hypothetical protein